MCHFVITDAGAPKHFCNIISTSLPTLTTPGGMIPSGTQNVILYCICTNDNIAVGPTIWFFNGVQVPRTTADGSGNPYYRNNVPSPLIIPLFVAPHNGTYSCGPNTNFSYVSSNGDNITLELPGMSMLHKNTWGVKSTRPIRSRIANT